MWRNARRRQQKSASRSARKSSSGRAGSRQKRLRSGLRSIGQRAVVAPLQALGRLPGRCAASLRAAFAALHKFRPWGKAGKTRGGRRPTGAKAASKAAISAPRRWLAGLARQARRILPRRQSDGRTSGAAADRNQARQTKNRATAEQSAGAAAKSAERRFGASLAPADRCLNLALQGGGAHGAFTWGVLDRLLDERKLGFEGISGTSAGAMNAAVLAQGLLDGGREGARAALRSFWHSVSPALPLSPRASEAALNLTRHFSPYQLNPLDVNPLRDTVERHVDFAALRRHSPVKLFIAATRVRSGSLVLFRESELDCDRLLASACLPSVHRAVEIDGEAYWDGGFSANPAIFPLLEDCQCRDNLLILLQPVDSPQTPRSSEAIAERIGELSFGSAFTREMQDIARRRDQRGVRFHLVQDEELMLGLNRRSKYDTRRAFLDSLFEAGREQTDAWLRRHRRHIGRRASIDIGKLFG